MQPLAPSRRYGTRFFLKLVYLWKTLTFSPYIIKKKVGDHSFNFKIANLMAKSWYDRVTEWPELIWVSENLISSGDCIIDCGAHHGLSTLVFAQHAGPTGHVIGIEAHPKNAEVAKTNIELNKFSNVKIINAAVGDAEGTVLIANHSNSSVIDRKQRKGISVQAVTLDSMNFPALPTVIKIDVERFELQVLRGAQKLLQTRPKIDLELHCLYYREPEKTLSEIAKLLIPLRYIWFIQEAVDSEIVGPVTIDEKLILSLAKKEIVHFDAILEDRSMVRQG